MNNPAVVSAERRQHVRKPLHGLAYVMLAGHPPIAVRTLEIGPGGIAIVAAANPPPKMNARLRLNLPTRSRGLVTVELAVTVLHSVLSRRENGFKVGLQFVDVPAPAQQAITAFLSLSP